MDLAKLQMQKLCEVLQLDRQEWIFTSFECSESLLHGRRFEIIVVFSPDRGWFMSSSRNVRYYNEFMQIANMRLIPGGRMEVF